MIQDNRGETEGGGSGDDLGGNSFHSAKDNDGEEEVGDDGPFEGRGISEIGNDE